MKKFKLNENDKTEKSCWAIKGHYLWGVEEFGQDKDVESRR